MTDPQIVDYSVYTGVMDNGQEILVQIFSSPESGKFLVGQIATQSAVAAAASAAASTTVQKEFFYAHRMDAVQQNRRANHVGLQ